MTTLLIVIAALLAFVCIGLAIKLSRTTTDNALLRQELDLTRRQSDNEDRFANLANRILNDTTRSFKEQNEQRLSEILAPLKEDLKRFGDAVSQSYNSEARERFSLSERIKELVSLNQSLSQQARELSEALRGNSKVQGDWGEMILDTLLEKSGLKKGLHYKVQETRDNDGNTLRNTDGDQLRPDVVIYYPDNRCVVVDSKVSLTAYINMINAESQEEATRWEQQHVTSVRSHIKELATKKYQDYVGQRNTDFVMMFIPNEAAYLTALNSRPTLWQEAYDSRVIIISPTHLLSALRLIEQLWRQDDIKRNATEIATEAGKMYDKFVGFLDDMTRIEKALDSAKASYDSAITKLSTGKGNLIRRASSMKELGAKAQKTIVPSLVDKSGTDI